jgi:hypothetical protein
MEHPTRLEVLPIENQKPTVAMFVPFQPFIE